MPTSGCQVETHRLFAELGQLSLFAQHKLRYMLSWRNVQEMKDDVRVAIGRRFDAVPRLFAPHAQSYFFSIPPPPRPPRPNPAPSPVQAPIDLRLEGGHSLKSSLQHEADMDFRDEDGHGLRLLLTNEVAGGKLGGDQHFAKNELKASFRAPLNEDGATYGFGVRAGLLAPLQDVLPRAAAAPRQHAGGGVALPILRPRPSHISDRFFLGGTLDVRGFHYQSIGPRAGRYATGADAFWAAAGHIWTPLPGRLRRHVGDAIQIHSFLNAGSAVTMASARPAALRAAAQELSNDVSVACGLGLSAKLSFCTVEVNYCVPLRAGAGGLPRPGLTASVGFEML